MARDLSNKNEMKIANAPDYYVSIFHRRSSLTSIPHRFIYLRQ
jgi:hypothetical protein